MWSVSTGFLAFLPAGVLLWPSVLLFVAAGLGLAWLTGGLYQAITAHSIQEPRLEADLSQLTATWGPSRLTTLLHVQLVALGLLVGLLLGAGIWLPIIDQGTMPASVGVALSGAGCLIAWKWVWTLWRMWPATTRVHLHATGDRIVLTWSRGVRRFRQVFPSGTLQVEAGDGRLTLAGPEGAVSLNCTPTPARAQLLGALREMSARAVVAPFTAPQPPHTLQALRKSNTEPT